MDNLNKLAYHARYKTKPFIARLKYSADLIADHLDYAVSTSWGKDSIALLHIAAQINPHLCVINARYPNPAERFADMDCVRDLMLSRQDMQHVRYLEVDTPGEWEMYERAGGGFAQAETKQQLEAARWWKDNFLINMGKALNDFGCSGVFLGLRAEESHARRMNVLVHGDDYQRKDGSKIALPIAKWSGDDVWTYIAKHDLPSLRIYDLASCGRERARSGFVFATGGAGAIRRHGVWEDWRWIYPEEFRAWVDRFPELDK